MSEEYPNMIEVAETSTKSRFPIAAQLSILAVVMIGLFGAAFFKQTSPDPLPPPPVLNITTDTNEYPLVPQKITEDLSLQASSVYVWDVKNQRSLYSKNADQALPLASITKLMTALLAYELVPEDKRAAVTLDAIKQEGSSGFTPGEQFTMDELREIALISSSNDAAYTMAANVGTLLGNNDPTLQFVSGMNIRAEELGLTSLKFKNPTGLDVSSTEPGATGNARDISFLMEYIITNYPEIISPTQKEKTLVYNTSGAYHEVSNTNEIVLDIPNLIGSKTGYTDLAGGNLTIAFDAGLDRQIIITVLGSTRDARFSDVTKLVSAVQGTLSKE